MIKPNNEEGLWYQALAAALDAVEKEYQSLKQVSSTHPIPARGLRDIASKLTFMRVAVEGDETALRRLREMEEDISWMQHDTTQSNFWDEAA
ncbi:hypothetical protein [Streptomyces spiramyceticus]|uniref:hypothetical protein n=1 Tax=Streptomyces spiramyceticus TaxID=299717 RepID=UPI00237B534A|nr:hypothetical protein [Streptomyces spiramyceticus]